MQCVAVVKGGAEIVSRSNLFPDDLHREFRHAMSRIIGNRAWRKSCGLTTESASSISNPVSTATLVAMTALTDQQFLAAAKEWPTTLFVSDAAKPQVQTALRSAADRVHCPPTLQVLHSLVPNGDLDEIAALCTAMNPSCQSPEQQILSMIFGEHALVDDLERMTITAKIVAHLGNDSKAQFAHNLCRAAQAGRSALALELALWR